MALLQQEKAFEGIASNSNTGTSKVASVVVHQYRLASWRSTQHWEVWISHEKLWAPWGAWGFCCPSEVKQCSTTSQVKEKTQIYLGYKQNNFSYALSSCVSPFCISPQGRSYRRVLRKNILTSLQAQFSNCLLSWEQQPLSWEAADLNILNISQHLWYVGLDCRNAVSYLICKQHLRFTPSIISYSASAPRPLHAPPSPSFHNLLWHPPRLWLATSVDQRGMHVQTGWPAHASVMFSLWESCNYVAAPGDLSLGTPMSSNQLLNFTNLAEIHYLYNSVPETAESSHQLRAHRRLPKPRFLRRWDNKQGWQQMVSSGSPSERERDADGWAGREAGQTDPQSLQELFSCSWNSCPRRSREGCRAWPATAGIYFHQEIGRGCKSAPVQ